MSFYKNLIRAVYNARRASVANLSPQNPKQPQELTLIKRYPFSAIAAFYGGLTSEQVASIYDNPPQEDLAHNVNKMSYNSVATKAEILIGELTKRGFFTETIHVTLELSNIEDLVNAKYPSLGKPFDEELVKKREKYRLEIYTRKMADYETMVTVH